MQVVRLELQKHLLLTQNRQLSNEPVAVETQIVEETPTPQIDGTSPSNGMDQ